MNVTNFLQDKPRGDCGELASLAPMSVYMPGVNRIELSKMQNRSNSQDFRIFTLRGTSFPIDIKTDWKSQTTGNMFFEVVSQMRMEDCSVFPDCNVKDILVGKNWRQQQNATKCVTDAIMQRLNRSDPSGLALNREGWGVKDLDHLVGYWCVWTRLRSFNMKTVLSYFEKTDLDGDGIGESGIMVLQSLHDQFMEEIGLQKYVFYVLDKQMLCNYVRGHFDRYDAKNVRNTDYTTLGYIVPLKELDYLADINPKHAKRYAWRM